MRKKPVPDRTDVWKQTLLTNGDDKVEIEREREKETVKKSVSDLTLSLSLSLKKIMPFFSLLPNFLSQKF